MICSLILIGTIVIGVQAIGKAEYKESYCIDALSKSHVAITDGYEITFLMDYKNPYTKLETQEIGNAFFVNLSINETPEKVEFTYGCCKILKGDNKLNKNKDCIYIPGYEEPSFKQRVAYFLKRFK